MNDLVTANSLERVKFRQAISLLEDFIKFAGDKGGFETGPEQYPVEHWFTPIDERFGCCMYARQIIFPAGHVVTGKIHKSAHINILLKGKIVVATEQGSAYMEAPRVIISTDIGVKKAAYAVDEVTWITVHLSALSEVKNLKQIESDLVAETYAELGLIDSTNLLEDKQ